MKNLIIFVDALPYKKIKLLPKVGDLLDIKSIEPSYGYSVNLHHQMFLGKTPDDMGFFGEYKFDYDYEAKKDGNFIIRIIDDGLNVLNLQFFRKAYRKFILRINDMIPFKRRKYFKNNGTYMLRELNKTKEYLGNNYKVYLEELDTTLDKNMNKRLEEMREKIEKIMDVEENLFLSFFTVDYYGHVYGPDDKRYDEIISKYDSFLYKIINYSKSKGADKIILASDHGMSTTKKHINLSKLEKKFSSEFGKSIVYFYDSLYFEAWGLNEKGNEVLEELKKELNSYEGKIINKDERIKYGFQNREFGDLIFVLDNGLAFSPNYFGYTKMKGYHGYAPGVEEQFGIVGTLNNNDENYLKEELKSSSLKKFINEYLKR